MISIYNKNDVPQYHVEVNDNSKLKQTLKGLDVINMTFTKHDNLEDLTIGYYIIWRGKKYTLLNEPSVNKVKTNEYRYNFDLYSPKKVFEKALCLYDADEVNPEIELRSDYFIFGTLEKHILHIISNINRVLGTNYATYGTIPTTTPINIQYENISCLSALNEVLAVFEYEWELVGSEIRIPENGVGTSTDLKFQFKQGLKGIERKKLRENELVTRLYALGSDRNITSEYSIRKGKRLAVDPIENNVGLYGIIEKVKVFDEIYPHRVGTVTALGDEEYKFTDSNMDFNVNEHILGSETPKITFNTGDLAGVEFEISSYNASTKEFVLNDYDDGNGLTLPNEFFNPTIGDTYVIHNIELPEKFINDAEAELRTKAQEYLESASFPTVDYEIKPDAVYFREQGFELNIGDEIEISDIDLKLVIKARIKELSQSLADPYLYTLKVGNKTAEGFVYTVNKSTSNLGTSINYNVDILNKTINHIKNKTTVSQAEQTTPVLIGNELLKDETKGLNFISSGMVVNPNYSDDPNKVYFSESKFTHLTIKTGGQEWIISSALRVLYDDAKQFIYLRCEKDGTVGDYIVSTERFVTDSGNEYYYFLIGVLSEVQNNNRTLNTLFSGHGLTSVTNVTNVTNLGASDTPEIVKDKYESNDNTNEFTDIEKTKLSELGNSDEYLTNDITFKSTDGDYFGRYNEPRTGTLNFIGTDAVAGGISVVYYQNPTSDIPVTPKIVKGTFDTEGINKLYFERDYSGDYFLNIVNSLAPSSTGISNVYETNVIAFENTTGDYYGKALTPRTGNLLIDLTNAVDGGIAVVYYQNPTLQIDKTPLFTKGIFDAEGLNKLYMENDADNNITLNIVSGLSDLPSTPPLAPSLTLSEYEFTGNPPLAPSLVLTEYTFSINPPLDPSLSLSEYVFGVNPPQQPSLSLTEYTF